MGVWKQTATWARFLGASGGHGLPRAKPWQLRFPVGLNGRMASASRRCRSDHVHVALGWALVAGGALPPARFLGVAFGFLGDPAGPFRLPSRRVTTSAMRERARWQGSVSALITQLSGHPDKGARVGSGAGPVCPATSPVRWRARRGSSLRCPTAIPSGPTQRQEGAAVISGDASMGLFKGWDVGNGGRRSPCVA